MQTPLTTSASRHIEFGKALAFGAWGADGGVLGSLVGELVHHQPGSFAELLGKVGLWFGIVGACITLALLVGHSYYLKRGLQVDQPALRGVMFGFLSGFLAGAVAQGTYTGVGPTELLRIVCWGIAGGLLGFALSFRIPNLGRQRGLWGGLGGGVVGGTAFIIFSLLLGGVVGRLVGVAAIGFFIGLMIVLAETAFREAWLEIRYGPNEMRNVTLGRESVSIGGDRRACTIFVRNAPPVAYRYSLESGRIFCEEVAVGRTAAVQPGDQKVVGNLTVSVCAAGVTARTAGTPSPTPVSVGMFSIRLSSGKTLRLGAGVRLTVSDVPGLEPSGDRHVVAEIAPNPSDPTVLGLKNLSRRVWSATTPAGDRKQIEPSRTIKLANGTRINFGTITGEIL